jgi:acyl-coenzyme A thioesterase PaaI-like protein
MAPLSDEELRYAVIEAMPLHRLLGMELGTGADRTAVRLPELPQTRNHLGGQAGATLFGVVEAATVAALFDRFGDTIDEIFAVPSGGEISFRLPARGGVLSRARVEADPDEVLASVHAGKKVALAIRAVVRDGRGRMVAEGEVVWHLAPRRADSPPALPRPPEGCGAPSGR